MSDYITRLLHEDEERFVVKAWLDSYRSSYSSGLLSLSPHHDACQTCGQAVDVGYEAVMGSIIKRILRRPGVVVHVVATPGAAPPNDLHGFIVVEQGAQLPSYKPPKYRLELRTSTSPLVHYVFVKKIYRLFGMARLLFAAAGVDPEKHFLCTCTTPISESIRKDPRKRRIPLIEWMPLSARFTKETSKIHDSNRHPPAVQQPRAEPDPRQRAGRHHEPGR